MIQEKEPIRISGLIVTELLRGCPSEEDAAALAESLLAWPAVEPVYPSTYEDAARLHRTARSRGLTIRGAVDCVVAALAIEHGLAILHLDRDYAALSQNLRAGDRLRPGFPVKHPGAVSYLAIITIALDIP